MKKVANSSKQLKSSMTAKRTVLKGEVMAERIDSPSTDKTVADFYHAYFQFISELKSKGERFDRKYEEAYRHYLTKTSEAWISAQKKIWEAEYQGAKAFAERPSTSDVQKTLLDARGTYLNTQQNVWSEFQKVLQDCNRDFADTIHKLAKEIKESIDAAYEAFCASVRDNWTKMSLVEPATLARIGQRLTGVGCEVLNTTARLSSLMVPESNTAGS